MVADRSGLVPGAGNTFELIELNNSVVEAHARNFATEPSHASCCGSTGDVPPRSCGPSSAVRSATRPWPRRGLFLVRLLGLLHRRLATANDHAFSSGAHAPADGTRGCPALLLDEDLSRACSRPLRRLFLSATVENRRCCATASDPLPMLRPFGRRHHRCESAATRLRPIRVPSRRQFRPLSRPKDCRSRFLKGLQATDRESGWLRRFVASCGNRWEGRAGQTSIVCPTLEGRHVVASRTHRRPMNSL